MYGSGYAIDRLRAVRVRGLAGRLRRAGAAAAVVAAAAAGFAVAAQGGSPRPQTTIVVQPGDTLWSIAAEHYPQDDVRVRVEDIERANRLAGPVIEAGQTLVLPG